MARATALDRLITYLAPTWGKRRAVARAHCELMHRAGTAYDAARRDRTVADWYPRNGLADDLILPDLPTMISRSRALCRNTTSGRAVVHAFKRNVVGCGISPNAVAKNDAGELRSDFNTLAERLFTRWADNPKRCDVAGRLTFWAMQRQVMQRLVEDGEIFVRRVITKDRRNRKRLALQVLEVDSLDDSLAKNNRTGNDIKRGIEVDEFNRPVRYYFRPHSNELTTLRPDPIEIPADQIDHIFIQERPSQTHGVPWLHAVMTKSRHLDEFDRWELYAAAVQACMALIITREGGDTTGMLNTPSGGSATDDDSNPISGMQPGLVFHGLPDEKVEGFMPTRPSGAYEPFATMQQRYIGAGVDLSYGQVSRDYTKGTYSGQRQELSEDKRAFEPLQDLLIAQLLVPVWQDFISIAVQNKQLEAPNYWLAQEDWEEVEWIPRGWPWIDPLKEMKADELSLKNGLTTKGRLIKTRYGLDPEVVYREQQREIERDRELGIYNPADAKSAQPQPATPGLPEPPKPQQNNGTARRTRLEIQT